MAGLIDPLETAALWQADGRSVATATVIATRGSSPCPPGARLAVDDQGNFAGSVSAGCIDTAVIITARTVLITGVPQLLEFGASDDPLWGVGLSCGGSMSVLVARADRALGPARLVALRQSGSRAVLATDLALARQILLTDAASEGDLDLAPADRALVWQAADRGEARLADLAAGRVFIEPLCPPLRMAIVGAVHIAQALAPMAAIAGYAVTIIDPRSSFATPERFPGMTLSTDWPDQAMTAFAPDACSAVVALSHDPKLDDPALIVAAGSPAFYIGALGSRISHASRIGRLAEAGLSAELIARIDGPAGVEIGALTPAEIALSILAGATRALRADRVKARTARAP